MADIRGLVAEALNQDRIRLASVLGVSAVRWEEFAQQRRQQSQRTRCVRHKSSWPYRSPGQAPFSPLRVLCDGQRTPEGRAVVGDDRLGSSGRGPDVCPRFPSVVCSALIARRGPTHCRAGPPRVSRAFLRERSCLDGGARSRRRGQMVGVSDVEPFLAILSNEPTRFKVVTTLGFRWRIQWALSDLGQHAKPRAIAP